MESAHTHPADADGMPRKEPPSGHPHGVMRRRDREITDRAEMESIIGASKVMHLALCDDNVPFLVPVFFAYEGNSFYFHSSRQGTKIGILKRNPRACVEISVDHGVIPNEEPCDFEAKHRTVIAFGRAVFITDEAEKIHALDRIVGRFTDRKFEYPKTNLERTAVVRIDIESMKGKKHGF